MKTSGISFENRMNESKKSSCLKKRIALYVSSGHFDAEPIRSYSLCLAVTFSALM